MKSFQDLLSNEKSEENQSNLSNDANIIKTDENQTSNLPYYHNDIDREKSEFILRSIHRPGCFLIRKHQTSSSSLIESPYVLSMISPSLKIAHYLLYRIDQRLFIKPFSDEFYHSVKQLVDAHRENPGVLPSILIEYPVCLKSNTDVGSSSSSSSVSSSSSTIQTDQLIRQQIIGQGHFGIVYKGLYNGEIPVAIKTFSKSCISSSDECESNMLSEARTMMHLSHPYLVHLYGISRFDNQLCLVTEYIPNGCLLFWLRQQKQQQLSNTSLLRRRFGLFSLQICDAMTYLESKSIIHRDLAARNCLIDDNADLVKVSDFGMARLMSSSMIYEGRCDTPFPLRWSSSEVLLYREYSSKSDVWAYGILLWEIYSLGQIPFGETVSNDVAAQMIKSGRMPNKPPLANQLIYRQIISPCWMSKPNDRPTFASLKETLNKIIRICPRPRSLH